MRKWLMFGFLLASLLMSVAYAVDEDESEGTAKEDKKTVHLPNGIDLHSSVKIEYGKPRVVVKAVYPELISDTENEHVDEFNALVSQFLAHTIETFSHDASQNQVVDKEIPDAARKNSLYIDFASSYLQSRNPIISIRFNIQGFIIGQAHPYHHHYTISYDLKEGEELTLADLFKEDADYLTVLAAYSKNTLLRKHLSTNDFIEKGTEATLENFKHWNLKPNGILITFDEYQVAPYVDGTQTVLVPYSILSDLVSKDSPISSCITHKKRCLNSNILTGGFIDEALLKIKRPINPPHGTLDPILSKR